jgi:hypothetical protein
MITPKQMEAIEQEAWENMFEIAPEPFKTEHNMLYKRVAGATCIVFPKYPIVHFNMVIGLGFEYPVTTEILNKIEQVYSSMQQPTYMIQYFDDEKPVSAADVFDSKGYKVAGGWERILWKVQPVNTLATTRNIQVKKVSKEDVDAWAQYIIDLYHYPVIEWLKGFWGEPGWEHFIAYENDKLVAARSVFIGKNNIAWSGVEAPVPIVMTKDLEPDRMIWLHLQQHCFDNNVEYLAADIECPAPGRDTDVYHSYAELGFEVKYLRKLYRK